MEANLEFSEWWKKSSSVSSELSVLSAQSKLHREPVALHAHVHTRTPRHTHTHTHTRTHTTYVHVTQHSRSIIYTYRTSVRLYTLSLYQLVLLSHVRMWRVAAPYCTVTCTAYNKAYGVNALTTWRTSIVARHRTRGVWMNLKEALTSRDSYRTELDSRSS